MSRQSVAPGRASYAAGSNTANSAAAMAKFLEKKKEFDAVSALHKASTLYLQRIEGLAEDCETMADSGQIHGEVLEQWPRMFQILNLFLAGKGDPSEDTAESLANSDPSQQRLVRIFTDSLLATSEEDRATL
ncbi:hypothetical protein MIND_00682300 [Mycena indigotica]|uniref:DASH complex subunit DAD2 n=1 Tax=Mycena indigotica TaxID=2126181 RepID=A0A8H6SLG1_9AGAR|nr:uncharacterized protein MIND_00682300 [Mycena indigotica]KAF7301178.1 hypothetical protein MIND_00682300 [Mycena indigotica]